MNDGIWIWLLEQIGEKIKAIKKEDKFKVQTYLGFTQSTAARWLHRISSEDNLGVTVAHKPRRINTVSLLREIKTYWGA